MSTDSSIGCFNQSLFKKKPNKQNVSSFKDTSQFRKSSSTNSVLPNVTKVFRILQFIFAALIFAFTIYMVITGIENQVYSTFASMILTVSSVYVVILSVDIVSHFSGSAVLRNVMLLFNFLGVILFIISGHIFVTIYTNVIKDSALTWFVLTTLIFCFVLALLFIFDVMSAFIRPKSGQLEMLFSRNECGFDAENPMQVLNECSDHASRKINATRRPDYVDTQTSAPVLFTVEVAENQTEPPNTTFGEVQTKSDAKEQTIQTTYNDASYLLLNPAVQSFPLTQIPLNIIPQYTGMGPSFVNFVQDKNQFCYNCNYRTYQEIKHDKTSQVTLKSQSSSRHNGSSPDTNQMKSKRLTENVTKVAMFSYVQRHKKTQTPTKLIISEEQTDDFDADETSIIPKIKERSFKEKRIKGQSDSTESDMDLTKAKENDFDYDSTEASTYRKKKHVRPIVRDTLYRNQ